jgi:hypothetical protein
MGHKKVTQNVGLTVEECDKFFRGHRGSDLNSDRITYPTEVLDVSAVQLPRPVAYPEEVRGGIVVLLGCWGSKLARNGRIGDSIHPSHGFFVVEEESLVADGRVLD